MSNFERSPYERVNNLRERQREKPTGPDFGKVKQLLSPYADIILPPKPEEKPREPVLVPETKAALLGWLREIQNGSKLASVGEKARHTCLLYGIQGAGKTTFASHFAHRLGLPLACIRSESLIGSVMGATTSAIAKLFDAMAQVEGQVVPFFDEFDSIATKRSEDRGGGATSEMARALNVLLTRIEKANGICLAATNRRDMIDPAIQRRFELSIEIGLPRDDERFAIVRMYADPFLPSDEDTDLLVDLTAGATPHLIEKLIRGVKRTHIMWGDIRPHEEETVDGVFRDVIQSVRPETGATVPPLWEQSRTDKLAQSNALSELRHMTWPWPRKENA